jgi:hypothetical protein
MATLETYNENGSTVKEENPEANNFEEVDFDEIEDKLNGKMDDGFQKPIFQTNTNAIIESAVLNRAVQPKKDSKDKEYYDMILKITTVVNQGKEEIVTTDNYGGLREYDDGFWSGKKSAFGKLKQKMKDEFGVETYRDLMRTIQGKEVKIKTETTEYNGEKYQKNIIQSFR